MNPIRAALIGAGNRGQQVFGRFALRFPEKLEIAAIAEPRAERRAATAADHRLGPGRVFADWRELFAADLELDAAIVATGDTDHVEPALEALARGLHVLLEKPIAPDAADCLRVVEAAERAGLILQIGHVLRYMDFYLRVHQIVSSGQLGALQLIDMREHVSYWHMAHSYVRGKFRNRAIAAPFILAKSCHDLDLLAWFAESRATQVSSFGALAAYVPERAPEGAPERCSAACPAQASCPWDAERFYLRPDDSVARFWPFSDLSADPSLEARRRALAESPYGRCVFRCDNDVMDHQVVSVAFESGLVGTLGVHGSASEERRTIRVSGHLGELRGVMQTGLIEVWHHGAPQIETIRISASPGHGRGDRGLIEHFCDLVARNAHDETRTSGRVALESHYLGFAAERARLESRVVDMATYRGEVAAAARGRL
ncbi:MAG TPA: Gfo/Idh/MocA family oxidoreductase [Myxococcota bacterium]|nr:Gfo/Idh/MocA family oxidoreductase [Myxococcota bacterium]